MSNIIPLEGARTVRNLQACHMSLYPTKDSLVEAIEYIESQAPYSPQDIFPLLMMYHNTLLKELSQ